MKKEITSIGTYTKTIKAFEVTSGKRLLKVNLIEHFDDNLGPDYEIDFVEGEEDFEEQELDIIKEDILNYY